MWWIAVVAVVVVMDFWILMAVRARRQGGRLPGRRVMGWDPSDPRVVDSDPVITDGTGQGQNHGHGHGFFGGGGFGGGGHGGGGHHGGFGGGGGDAGGGGHHH